MAYSGWLLKIGNYTVPMSFMKPETYSPYVNMQDLDDYTDANGYLHRNAVELKALKVEFETRAMLTNTEFNAIISKILYKFVQNSKIAKAIPTNPPTIPPPYLSQNILKFSICFAPFNFIPELLVLQVQYLLLLY